MIQHLLFLAAVVAAVPGSLLPEVDRSAFATEFSEAALAAGRTPAEATLACRPFAEGLVLCFTFDDGGKRRFVKQMDLDFWSADLAAVEAVAMAQVAAGLTPERPERVTVSGDQRTYLLSAAGDGLDQAALFAPQTLASMLGSETFAVGLPARGVFIAFPLGDPELDQMVSVGVRRAYETLAHPITSLVYTWGPAGWTPWGEAKPASESLSPDFLERRP